MHASYPTIAVCLQHLSAESAMIVLRIGSADSYGSPPGPHFVPSSWRPHLWWKHDPVVAAALHTVFPVAVQAVFTPAAHTDAAAHVAQGAVPVTDQVDPATHDLHCSSTEVPALQFLQVDAAACE